MMLGEVIAVDSGAIIGLRQRQPIGVKLAERHAGMVHVIENAEFHECFPEHVAVAGAPIASCPGYRHSTFLIS